jgi:uncharacterized protein (TIGR03067 family)
MAGMKRVLMSACALALLGSNPFDADLVTTQRRSDNLAGRWKVLHSEQYQGKQLRGDDYKGYQLVLDEQKLKVVGSTYTYQIDPNYEPRQIDIMVGETRVQGIYRLEGNRLTLCYPMAGQGNRPSRFAAQPDSAVIVLVMQKE